MNLDILQKVRYRYQQMERGAAVVANSMGRAAVHTGLADWLKAMRAPVTDMLTWDPQALARRHVAAARNVFRSAARQPDHGPLLRTIWKRVLDATDRAGPRIV